MNLRRYKAGKITDGEKNTGECPETHSVRTKLREKLLLWQFNHTKWNRFSKWEHPDAVKERVLQVFDKYLSYDKVIVY